MALLDRVSVFDARNPLAATVLLEGRQGSDPLRYVDLTAFAPTRLACCLIPGRTESQTEVLRLDKADQSVPVVGHAAAPHPPLRHGLVGLAIAGQGVRVRRLSAQRLDLRWRGAGRVSVSHCLSQEGMHVRLWVAAEHHPSERHYYLPLGSEVEVAPALRCK